MRIAIFSQVLYFYPELELTTTWSLDKILQKLCSATETYEQIISTKRLLEKLMFGV
jgi:hypothetical protein